MKDTEKCIRQIHIRQMKLEEIPVCVRIIREAFTTVAEEFGITPENAPRFTAFAIHEERLRWQFTQEKRLMMVAESVASSDIVGYYSIRPVAGGICELNNLAVVPDRRHQGIGGLLLRDSFCKAKEIGCSILQIGIIEENRLLRRWYENAGFVHVGVKKFDFFPFTCGYMEITL